MFSTPWKQKTLLQKGAFISFFLGVCAVCFIIGALAASLLTRHENYEIGNGRGSTFEIELGGEVAGIDILPGTEQTINPNIKNAGTEELYLFVRFDTSLTSSNSPIYDYVPTGSGWSRVDMGENAAPGEIIYVYGTASAPTAVMPDETVTLNGKMTAVVSKAEFVDLTDDDFVYTVHGCAILSKEAEGTAKDVYGAYLSDGGV